MLNKNFTEWEIAVHPNDGGDLNLYTRDHSMAVFAGSSLEAFKKGDGMLGDGMLHLLNDCQNGTLMVSESLLSQLRYCSQALLIRDEERLFITFRD